MDHLICFSGGHSSALVAIEVKRRYPNGRLILLNHNINARVEDGDIKRFKREIADYLKTPITFANYADPTMDQFDIALKHSAWKTSHESVICTSRLKTEPFEKYLRANYKPNVGDVTIYYGFDAGEDSRITRRSSILAAMGYRTDYPLALWRRTILSTLQIKIKPPLTYSQFKHANCTGCIKGGRQHWYVVFCTRQDIWEKAKAAEEEIGYSIIRDAYLSELEPLFIRMKCAGIQATERKPSGKFWAEVHTILGASVPVSNDDKPCECVI